MRELLYYVATSLDGYIAREDGSFDAFPWDDAFVAALGEDFPETLPAPMRAPDVTRDDNRVFDTVLMGRKTYEVGASQGLTSPYPTLDQVVVSRSLTERPDPAIEVLGDGVEDRVRQLKKSDGRAIWLCGGGSLAATLFAAGLVDGLIVKLNPVLFGSGIPMIAGGIDPTVLERTDQRTFPSGHAILHYRRKP